MKRTAIPLALGAALACAPGEGNPDRVGLLSTSGEVEMIGALESFVSNRASCVVLYDTDRNYDTIEEAVRITGSFCGMARLSAANLSDLPLDRWEYLTAPGATPKLYSRDATTMTPEQQGHFDFFATLGNQR